MKNYGCVPATYYSNKLIAIQKVIKLHLLLYYYNLQVHTSFTFSNILIYDTITACRNTWSCQACYLKLSIKRQPFNWLPCFYKPHKGPSGIRWDPGCFTLALDPAVNKQYADFSVFHSNTLPPSSELNESSRWRQLSYSGTLNTLM
jgi:hypothetical protein